jgi:MGT family glycosyltransferase
MKRQHFAIFTALGHGHVYPALGLCSELARRGHRVTFATDKSYESLVKQASGEAVLFTSLGFESSQDLRNVFEYPSRDWWAKAATVGYPLFLVNAAMTVLQLEDYFKINVPDAIIYDRIAFSGRILAKRIGCRAVQIYPHFAYCRKSLYREGGVCVNPAPILIFAKLLDTFMAAYGIEGADNLWHTEDLNIYFIPKAFQYHSDEFDDRSCFAGPCLNRPFKSTWRDCSNGKPIILISDVSGSLNVGYFRMFVGALAELSYHVILSIGPNESASSIGHLPSNFEVNRHSSHLEILPHTALSICQSGMGSVLEAIHYGVPLMTFPASPFHEEIAWRVAELGLGMHLARSATAESIRRAVSQILHDGAMLDRVKQMQKAFRSSGGAQMAADRIEAFLSSAPVV